MNVTAKASKLTYSIAFYNYQGYLANHLENDSTNE
jgi:hypothetical protein